MSQIIKIILPALLGMLLFSGCHHLQHQEFVRGQDWYDKKCYRLAFYHLMPLAKLGDKGAQYAVGYMYYYGQGVIENRELGEIWIAKAAAGGHVAAKTALAQIEHDLMTTHKPTLHA